MLRSFFKICFIILLNTLPSSLCQAQKIKKHKKHIIEGTSPAPATATGKNNSAPGGCDADLWKYVYNAKRLKLVDQCITVSGIIKESSENEDGDHHMLLKPDAGQQTLINNRNIKSKEGNLVIEAVCANNTTLKKVGSTCEGYVNKVQIPKLGEHVKVTGSYVIDTHNGWAEIHPITKIDIIK